MNLFGNINKLVYNIYIKLWENGKLLTDCFSGFYFSKISFCLLKLGVKKGFLKCVIFLEKVG